MDVKAVNRDQLVEKLDSLGMKNSRPGSEGSYDYIEERADTVSTPVESNLSIRTTEQWERQLMKDPKVLYSLFIEASIHKLIYNVEPTCSFHTCKAWKQCTHPTLSPYQGHPELQCQDLL